MAKHGLVCFSIVALVALSAACSRLSARENEVVLCPGASIEVTVGEVPFSIKSSGLLIREVRTGGVERVIKLIPRTERWFGSLGLYNPAAGDSGIHIIMEEGQQHFSSVGEMRDWIQFRRSQSPLEYTSEGLVVSARYQTRPRDVTDGPESAMAVEVWQLLVNGRRPIALAGAHDERFKSIQLPPTRCSQPKPFVASPSKEIKGRRFSGRVLDVMKERGFTVADVERILATGDRSEQEGRTTFTDKGYESELSFVEILADGTVVQIG